MELKEWLKALSSREQDCFYKQAARFFTNTELIEIVRGVKGGQSLYLAHLRAGVLDRYTVDLNNIKRTM